MRHQTVYVRLIDLIEGLNVGDLFIADTESHCSKCKLNYVSVLESILLNHPVKDFVFTWYTPLYLKKQSYTPKEDKKGFNEYVVSGSEYVRWLYLAYTLTSAHVMTYSTSDMIEEGVSPFKLVDKEKITNEAIPLCYFFDDAKFNGWVDSCKPSKVQLIIARKFITKSCDFKIPITKLITNSFREVIDCIPGKLTPILNINTQ